MTLIDTGVDQTFNDDLAPFETLDARLADSFFNYQPCKDAYFVKLKRCATRSPPSSETTRQAIRTQIEPFVSADPRKEYNLVDFANAHANRNCRASSPAA